ncbi:MAG: zinc-ribbon domain containing protein [Acidobacteriaceae bacterium]|nr:zinc-ribbon domain containing protein [Acidobacteriaceae bacterium]
MDFVDRTLKCVECGKDFIFTAGEQLFFHDKQFSNDPKRCKDCKSKRSSQRRKGDGTGRRSGTETRTHCSQCGVETTVPFRPTQGRPVLCRSCFQGQQSGATAPPAEQGAPVEAGMTVSELATENALSELK